MRKNRIIILTLIILLILATLSSVFVFLVITGQTKKKEVRQKIPYKSVWRGDLDEGFWITFVDVDKQHNLYHFKIYDDYNGELYSDAFYKTYKDCKLPLDSTILNIISFVQFDSLYIGDRDCWLKKIE